MTKAPRGRERNAKPTARMHPDRKVLIVFIVTLTVVSVLVAVAWSLRGQGAGPADIIMVCLGALTFSFLPTGMAAYKYHRLAGIIRTRLVIRWLVVFSLALDLLIMIFIFLLYEMGWFGGSPDPRAVSPYSSPASIAATTIALFVVFFLILLVYLMVGVGVIWLMAALERRLAPEALLRIRRLGRATSDQVRRKDLFRFIKYSALRWIFNIPEVLDTEGLRVGAPAPSKRLPWKTFSKAMGWSVVFGTVIAIDFSFNPFLRESFSIQQLFSIISVASIFIPWLVLPWFIFRRLDAQIPGQRRAFRLYDGLRSRVYGTLVALGTLMLVIRLALREVPLSTILSAFFSYYTVFLLLAGLFTFVYFNYFEDNLAADVARAYGRPREKEKARRNDEEE